MKTSKIKTVRNIGRIRTLLVTLSVAVCLATLMGCGNTPFEDRIKKLHKAAEQGDAEAQNSLGFMYEGNGVAKDDAEALKWYRKAAEQGHALAQFKLGRAYERSVPGAQWGSIMGVPADNVAAYAWYSVGGNQYIPDNLDLIKRLELTPTQVEKGEAMAREIFERIEKRKAAKADHTSPAEDGIERLRKAAEQAVAAAQFSLGMAYASGDGVPQDYAEAVKWWRKAAEQGDAEAQFYLGPMYSEGRGVPMDKAEAFKWYRKAAEQGHAVAQKNLSELYFRGRGVPQDDAEAVNWLRKAAEQGYVNAQFSLGHIYWMGRGVTKDDVAAYAWYSEAAASGYGSGRHHRDRIKGKLTPSQLEKGQAMAREISERIEKRKAAEAE